MKKIIKSAVLLLAVSQPVTADVCDTVYEVSASIMNNRQLNTPMPKMMKIAASAGADDKLREFMEEIVVLAYKQPRYDSAKYQERSIRDFANEMYLECINN